MRITQVGSVIAESVIGYAQGGSGQMLKPRFLKLAFWAAVLFTFIMATLPKPPQLPGSPSDKVQHIAAFLTLSVLAAQAYPRIPMWRIAMALSCFGAAIEIVQAIPIIHRDSEFLDWVADTVACVAVFTLVGLWRWRRSRKYSQRNARGQPEPAGP
jgi:VanZ family protein